MKLKTDFDDLTASPTIRLGTGPDQFRVFIAPDHNPPFFVTMDRGELPWGTLVEKALGLSPVHVGEGSHHHLGDDGKAISYRYKKEIVNGITRLYLGRPYTEPPAG